MTTARSTTRLNTPYERMLAGIDDDAAPVFSQAGPKSATVGEKVADSAIALGSGLVGGVKMLTDVFGADNSVSEFLGDAQKNLDAKTSDERQHERRQRQQQIRDAEL